MGSIKVSNLMYTIKEAEQDKTILNNISYNFEEGKLTTISGPSGSGKTTFLYALSGILEITSGNVSIMETSIYDLPVEKRDNFRLNNMGLIYQNLNLLNFMNIEDNIFLPFYLKREEITNEKREKLSEYLNLLGLGQIQKRNVSSLSGGEQQRVAIIRSIISRPSVILCDEPTGSLDSTNTRKFMDAIIKIKDMEKSTIIMVTHDKDVYDYGDIKIKIVDGNLIS